MEINGALKSDRRDSEISLPQLHLNQRDESQDRVHSRRKPISRALSVDPLDLQNFKEEPRNKFYPQRRAGSLRSTKNEFN